MKQMQISKFLSLDDVTRSFQAKKHGIDNTPDADAIENLKWIGQTLFDPLKAQFPDLFLESAYRNLKVNKLVGGSASSQHLKGEAIDVDDKHERKAENKKVFDFVVKNLDFDQVIWEFGDETGPDWVHISCKRNNLGNRKKITRAVRKLENGRFVTRYLAF